MIAFSIASRQEWYSLCNLLNITDKQHSPFGELFFHCGALFYQSLTRKSLSSASAQWVIDHYDVSHLIVLGTCAGVNSRYKELNLFQFSKAVQCDVLDESFGEIYAGEVNLYCFEELSFLKSGTISAMDRPLIQRENVEKLIQENIDCDDMESAAVALVCEMNHVR